MRDNNHVAVASVDVFPTVQVGGHRINKSKYVYTARTHTSAVQTNRKGAAHGDSKLLIFFCLNTKVKVTCFLFSRGTLRDGFVTLSLLGIILQVKFLES